MSRPIQAYFHTENEAEDVRIKLQTYQVEQVEIGKLDEAPDRDTPLLFPIAIAGTGTIPVGVGYAGSEAGPIAATGVAAAGAYLGFRTLDEAGHDKDGDGVDDRKLRYALSTKVAAEQYDEIVDLIRRHRGHVAKLD
ncbi:hypothetical protein NLX71_17870 [Paenibacillus sp. MZ04-78.2]|uniref:hypothetical protein n=1 Tax=Paenibacillus sp. MZ04-78.2 TaxID=2962034 RepID=UPI0020B6B568|nr:hypothetical protein [Paenibacillus sp. MZ04-78.2]MCP3775142.1 hypothetical protein [Paenibacillus sp. MZ04-78.2]